MAAARFNLLGLLLLTAATRPQAAEGEIKLGLLGLKQQSNPASPYALGPARPADSVRRSLDLRWQGGGGNTDASWRSTLFGGAAKADTTRLNQLYFDSEIENGQGWTLGKKVISWGMGQGFRPLDVVQRENRRQIEAPPLEGKPLVAWQHFLPGGTLTVLGQLADAPRPADSLPTAKQALAAQWYAIHGDADIQLVARLGKGGEREAGGGLSLMLNDDWQAHAAGLRRIGGVTRTHHQPDPAASPLISGHPLIAQAAPPRTQAVAGLQWTQQSAGQGWSLLAETWYDGEAWRRSDWQALSRLTARQRALTGLVPQAAIEANLAGSAQAFATPNLLRENLMLRATYDAAPHWSASLDWLRPLRDSGHITTLTLQYSGQQQQWRLGLRNLSGPADSVLAQSPLSRQFWLAWQLALN